MCGLGKSNERSANSSCSRRLSRWWWCAGPDQSRPDYTGAQAAANASANYVWATGPYVAESSGEIQSVSLYTSQAGVAVSLGVWLDVAGVVGDLVAASVAGATLLNDWVTLAATGDIVEGQSYWIGWNCQAVCSLGFSAAIADTTKYKARTYTAGAQPNPYPAAPTTLPRRYPLYLTYLGT